MKFKDMPYKRVDMDEVTKKFNEICEKFKAAKDGEEQYEVHKEYYEFTDEIFTMSTIAHIRHDVDTKDEFYEKEQEYYDNVMPKLSALLQEYSLLVYNSKYRDVLEKHIGKVAFKNIELELKSFDEKLIPLIQEENALKTTYSKLIATAEIEWEGEILNLSLMRKHMTDKDRATRKKAYEKTTEFFLANKDELDDIYDKLVKNRTQQAKAMGYENYVELGYYKIGRNCYGKEQVANFRKQVKEVLVPFAEKLHDRRRQRLGLDKLLHYDELMNFSNGNPQPNGTPEEILKLGQKMYSELAPETKEFFDFMMENELFDVIGRKTKRAGGYKTSLPKYKAPFVFANFNGTAGDIDVITHECGHAFQGFVVRNEEVREVADITMETAEIHSMSMEFFTEPWMNLFFGDRTQDYLDMHLEEAVCFIPYGCMVDEFQHIVYENPDMTPAERNEAWKKLEAEYKPHLDYDNDPFFGAGRYWQKQQHIYMWPFYYIDYCLAQTCALEYKTMMDEDYKAAWNSYLKLCNMSARDFFTNMIPEVGLKSPFEDGCLKEVVEKMSAKLK